MSQGSAFAATDLYFRYRSDAEWAIQGIDLSVAPGEVLGLLGPNGAGKTTLLRLASGLLRPQRGTAACPPAPAFALVGQENAFYPRLTCRENLLFFAAVARVPRQAQAERIETCMRATALDRLAQCRAEECSGGAKRRLSLAIGLLADPALLLLDEPTAHVDPQARAFLLDAVRALRDAGKAIVYASHLMDEVEAVADRISILDGGRQIAAGRLDEILGRERRLRVRLEPGAVPPPRWQSERAGWWSIETDAGEVPGAIVELERAGIAVRGIHYGARNLEEVFLSLTRRSLRD